ncbi:Cu/Pi carrier [Xanthoria parietina]
MAPLFPTAAVLQDAFSTQVPFARSSPPPPPSDTGSKSSYVPPSRRFSAWSAVDDVKSKAGALSNEAQKEIAKASSAAQAKTGQMELFSPSYYAACTFGGLMACGVTHTAVTPLDLVKCRRQVDSKMYKGNFEAWGKIGRAEGMRGIFTGWAPTFFGYSAQGAFKYGGYEYFKKFYSDLAGEEAAYRYKTGLYLAASASAEFIADVALCPFEAVKVRMQTTIPPFASSTFGGISIITGKEGTAGLYKGLYPLWGRQIPYTMMKFASFETIVEAIYGQMPKSKSEYGKGVQTGVSFAGGYLAGILCAIVSHPADVMVSKLNANRQPGEAFGAATSRIYKDIGFGGLWNGLVIRIFMIGTLTSLQWGIYDSFKVFMGFPTTGGAAPPPKQTATL